MSTIKARGLHAERFGLGWRVRGPGVDLLVQRLGNLDARDLAPMFD